MKRFKKIEISVAIALVISVIVSVSGFAVGCRDIRSSAVRLHILANSDSEADQAVKLLVRDALLECGSELFDGSTDTFLVEKRLENEKEKLISVAEKVLRENGFDYGADIILVNEYFSTREYEGFTMPAGRYLALRVILGKGEGHNWWCVMFPPLCLPAASQDVDLEVYFGSNGASIAQSKPKYEIRFKIVDIIESIKEKLSN